MMLSSHLCLGLYVGLVVKGLHLNIFLAALVPGILCTWPNQLSLWALITPEITTSEFEKHKAQVPGLRKCVVLIHTQL